MPDVEFAATDTVTFGESADLTKGKVFTVAETLTFGQSADLTRGKVLAATDTLTFGQSASLVDFVTLESWTADQSQSAFIKFNATAQMELNVPIVAPPADVYLDFVKRVSLTMPSPTLDSRGRPT